MVSFFGLKLGADKKKKTERAQEPKPAPTRKRIDQNTLGEGQFFGNNLERPLIINGSRPGTSMSNKSFVANFAHPNSHYLAGVGASPYSSRPGTAMSNKNFVANFQHPNAPYLNGGASSMVDLGGAGGKGGGVRPMGSEGNLKTGWNNGSVTNLNGMPTPPIITSDSRPGTPSTPGNGRGPKWIHPLDVHFNRDGALSPAPSSANSATRSPGFAPSLAPSAAPSVSNAPRSPLGQFEFNLNPSTKPNELTPAPLSPTKSYPSPPQSVNGSLPPIRTDLRPKTANGPVSSIRDAHRPGPAALPSPTASAERTSEEERYYPRPIIQNVAAKRDTLTSLTVHTPRRQSFSMNIDRDLTGFNFGENEKTQDREQPINFESSPAPTSPPPRSRLRPTPPELKNLHLPPAQLPPQGPLPRSPGGPPPRPPQVPYEGPLRSPARAPDDWVKARERMGPDARDQTNYAARDRMNSDPRDRINESRARQDSDPRERANPAATRIPESRLPRNEPTTQPQGYFGPRPPPSARRVPPGEGERSYGITPANRRPPPPPVELQRKASNPQIQQGGWEDRDVQHGSFSMISPRMQPPTPNTLAPEPSSDANWPLPSPLASPTFGSGRRPYTPSEQSEGQMSPGLVMPPTPGVEQGRDYRRHDFGLRAPTGIAEEFRIGFI